MTHTRAKTIRSLRCDDSAGRNRESDSFEDCADSYLLYLYISLSTSNCLCHVGSHLTPYIFIGNFDSRIIITFRSLFDLLYNIVSFWPMLSFYSLLMRI